MFRSHYTTALLLALATLALSALVTWLRPPLPRVQDEFSYLLASDTYAHGRMTNPTHPLWQHFETMHVIQQPSYMSKYPPGQGLMLAIGQVVTNRPIVGVWITSALAVVACYWLLLAFAPPKWATLGAACLILHPGFLLIWGQSYWGGTLAFAGGALVVGGALRLMRRGTPLRTTDGLWMVVGALVLAVTRPFEGVLTCLVVVLWMVVHWTRYGWPPLSRLALHGLLPQVLLSALGLWGLAQYNRAVTGDPLTMPYQVHEQMYGMCPLFLFQSPMPERHYRHDSLRKFHAEWSMNWYRDQQNWGGLLETKGNFLRWTALVLLPYALLVPVLALPWWRGTRWRWPLVALVAVWGVTQITIWNFPHYIAPVAPLVFVVVVEGLRNLRVAARHFTWNRLPVRLLVGVQVVLCVCAIAAWAADGDRGWNARRQAIQQSLEHQPGRHLVLVEYSPEHPPHEEWVWNEADIDGAKVVWARAMSPPQQAELMEYFRDREVWHLAADSPEPHLARFSAEPRHVATADSHP